jgi:hypothetical protein
VGKDLEAEALSTRGGLEVGILLGSGYSNVSGNSHVHLRRDVQAGIENNAV